MNNMSALHKATFGDHFDNQKDEQFPSRFRKQDYSSPKFVQQQKLKQSGSGTKFQQLMEASLYNFDSPKNTLNTSHNGGLLEPEPKIIKSQSVSKVKNKQYIVFPKIQQSIRDQQQQERNNLFMQYANTPHTSLMQNKSISSETIKMIYSQPYIHYQNVKKIRKISPDAKVNHVCKKSVIIPYQHGTYTMPGLPNNDNRSKKLTNLSFTKMQWNITNYNINFALSKKEQEIRDFLKGSKVKKLSIDQGKDHQDHLLTLQGSRTTTNQQTDFNFFTTYSKSPKSDNNTPSLMTSPSKKGKNSHHA